MAHMTIRYLKTFIAIAERGSFAAAARYLNLTQSAISMQMKTLEDDLERKLFDRSKRPPQFTPAGRALIPKARKAIEAFELLMEDEGEQDPQVISGKIHIGAVPSIMSDMVPRALYALNARHPELHVSLTMGSSADLVEQVATGRLNAAIISDLNAKQDALVWRPIVKEPLVLIVPANAPDKTAIEFLKDDPFIRYTRQAWVGQLIDRLLKKHRLSVNDTMTLDTLDAVTAMVYHGLGVSIVPASTVQSPHAFPVRQINLPSPPVYRVLGFLEHRDNDRSAATDALLYELSNLVSDGSNSPHMPIKLTARRRRAGSRKGKG